MQNIEEKIQEWGCEHSWHREKLRGLSYFLLMRMQVPRSIGGFSRRKLESFGKFRSPEREYRGRLVFQLTDADMGVISTLDIQACQPTDTVAHPCVLEDREKHCLIPRADIVRQDLTDRLHDLRTTADSAPVINEGQKIGQLLRPGVPVSYSWRLYDVAFLLWPH